MSAPFKPASLPLIGLVLFLAAHIAQAQTAALVTTAASQTHYGKGLGRLLTTEAERAKIDDLRFYVAPPPKPVQDAGPALLQIDGVTMRPDRPIGQKVTVWIDGRPYLENALPPGLKLLKNANGEVTGMSSKIGKNKTAFAQIGAPIPRPQTTEEAEAERQAAENLLKAATSPTSSSALTPNAIAQKAKDLAETSIDKAKVGVQGLLDKIK